jgi:gamma-glutamyltranspeptidase/glutathione hydrolase
MPTVRTRPILAGIAALALGLLASCGLSPAREAPTAAPAVALPAAPEAASGFTPKPGVSARRFIVASAHPLATDAGHAILTAGGSAVDAAIAVQMVLTLVEPQSSGIGGGLFLVHHDGRDVVTLDGRETAPMGATPDLFLEQGRPLPFMQGVVGGRSVGTPGVVRALALAHRRYGKLPWHDLFTPAIELAEAGFPIGPRLAALLREDSARGLRLDPDAAAYFFRPDGSPKPADTPLRNPALAAVLREVAQRGEAAFYEGPLAQAIVDKVRGHARNPGRLALADLANYRAVQRDPLCFDYKAWRVCGMGPPSSGTLAVGQMLGMLESRPLAPPVPAPFGLEPGADAVHAFSEAGRLAYADRARYVADPEFAALPSPAALLAPAYLRERAALIGARSMQRAAPGVPEARVQALADDRSAELPSTSHVSIADADGNTLAMTTTIENAFGAQIMVGGFLLNNQLTDFSYSPQEAGVAVANRVEPGKRPRSSMSPLLVFERRSGELLMSLGTPGGSAIINYTAKVLLATLDWGLDVEQAIALPNFGSRNGPTELERDRSTPALVSALEARGHEVRVLPLTSGMQALQRTGHGAQRRWFGAADPRREGQVRGD